MRKRTGPPARWQARSNAWLAATALLGLLSLGYAPADAQEKKTPSLLPPVEKGAGAVPATPVITLGTGKDTLDLYLGAPRTGEVIGCLCRSNYTYADGTYVILFKGGVLSLTPGTNVKGSPEQGYKVEREGLTAAIDPVILRGSTIVGPVGVLKTQVEDVFYIAPPGAPCQLFPSPLIPYHAPFLEITPAPRCAKCYRP